MSGHWNLKIFTPAYKVISPERNMMALKKSSIIEDVSRWKIFFVSIILRMLNVLPRRLKKARSQYSKIENAESIKDVVSIPGISMTYVLNKAL